MNTRTAPVTTETNYCPGCDKLVHSHICLDCNDYAITVAEATEMGFLMSFAPADCPCDLCND